MIQLYKKSNTNYEYNGDYTLHPFSCELEQTLNDTWQVTLEIMNDDEAFDDCTEEAVLAIPTPNSDKQLFRIYKVEKEDISTIAYALPIFLDAANDTMLFDVRPTDKTGQQALDIMCAGTKYSGSSDITDISTSYYIRKNLVEAIASDDENSFLNRWGGEISYDNFKIIVNKSIGVNNVGRVAFGYNMTGIKMTIDTTDIVTRIIPLSYNGYMLEGDSPWVDSPLINNYAKVYKRVIEYSDIKLQEDCSTDEQGYNTLQELRAALITRAKQEYENGIDIPAVSYEVNMIDLSQYDEYKDFAELEKIHLGDKAICENKRLGIDTIQEVVKLVYDCVSKRVTSITLSTVEDNFFNAVSSAISKTKKAINENGTVKGETIAGTINLMNAKLRASHEISSPQSERAILFEDNDTESGTYGAMALGTTGFMIASEKDQNGEWVWTTFGTGEGFLADCIIAGVLVSKNYIQGKQGVKIDLDTGLIEADQLEYKGNSLEAYVQTEVDDAVKAIESHDIYEIEEEPTLYNHPACEWYIRFYPSEDLYPSEELKWQYDYTQYVGSIAYTPAGECYVFRYIDKEYFWQQMTGTETAYILEQITKLKVEDGQITTEVKKVSEDLHDNYYTIKETDTKVSQTADEIKTEASKTYTPLTKMEDYPTKIDMNSAIIQSAEHIEMTVSKKYTTKETTESMQSQITQTATAVTSKVSKGDVSSTITQESGGVDISGQRFTWTDNYSQKSPDGYIKMTNGYINVIGSDDEINIYSTGREYNSWIYPQGIVIEHNGVISSYKYDKSHIHGELIVEGTKNRIVKTKTYGYVAMNAFETMGAHFADIGSGIIIDEICVIDFNDRFREVIDSDVNYQILITNTGEKNISYVEKCPGYVIVHGESGATFDWMLICKQKDYSDLYGNTYIEDGTVEIPLTSDERVNQSYDVNIESIIGGQT